MKRFTFSIANIIVDNKEIKNENKDTTKISDVYDYAKKKNSAKICNSDDLIISIRKSIVDLFKKSSNVSNLNEDINSILKLISGKFKQ
jgi:hypothetical protein